MSSVRRLVVCCFAFVSISTLPAWAHPIQGVGDFYAGMLHPITALESMLPIVGIALLAGQQTRETAVRLLMAVPLAVVLGAMLSSFGRTLSHSAVVLLGISTCLGILVALAARLSTFLIVPLAALLGVTIGWTNAAEITGNVSPYRFVAGLAVVVLLITCYGVGLVRTAKAPWAQVAVRVIGSWIAAVGILVLGLK